MPKALERSLKRKVAHKDWSQERKDAYVYGVLRKTGWTPSHQKKMSANERVIRLSQINENLDKIIHFQYYDQEDEDRKRNSLIKTGVGVGALGAAGAGALYGLGRYGGGAGGVRNVGTNIAAGARTVGQKATSAYQAASPYLKSGYETAKTGLQTGYQASKGFITNLLKRFRLSAEGKLIEFQSEPDYKRRLAQRTFLGPGTTVLIHGQPGQRFKGALQAGGRSAWETAKGTAKGGAIGVGGGAALGSAAGALFGLAERKPGMAARQILRGVGRGAVGGAGAGAAIGGLAGADIGATVGGLYGRFGKRATEIYRQRTGQMSAKTKNLIRLNSKLDRVINFAYPNDPTADQFGQADPGIQANLKAGDEKFGAMQALRLKIARLKAMGLYNY